MLAIARDSRALAAFQSRQFRDYQVKVLLGRPLERLFAIDVQQVSIGDDGRGAPTDPAAGDKSVPSNFAAPALQAPRR